MFPPLFDRADVAVMMECYTKCIPNVELEFSKPLYENDQFKWGTFVNIPWFIFAWAIKIEGLIVVFLKVFFILKYITILLFFIF
jgi:hypothetical protein